jgi:hypothetical protein
VGKHGLDAKNGAKNLLPSAGLEYLSYVDDLQTVIDSSPSKQHTKLLVVAREKIFTLLPTTTFEWMNTDHKDHPSRINEHEACMATCQALFKKHLTYVSRPKVEWLLATFDSIYKPGEAKENYALCDACLEWAKVKHARGRKKAWHYLPTAFGMEKWT